MNIEFLGGGLVLVAISVAMLVFLPWRIEKLRIFQFWGRTVFIPMTWLILLVVGGAFLAYGVGLR